MDVWVKVNFQAGLGAQNVSKDFIWIQLITYAMLKIVWGEIPFQEIVRFAKYTSKRTPMIIDSAYLTSAPLIDSQILPVLLMSPPTPVDTPLITQIRLPLIIVLGMR